MFLVTQAPNGRCTLKNSSSPHIPNLNSSSSSSNNNNKTTSLFSKKKPKIISRKKPLNLTLVANAADSSSSSTRPTTTTTADSSSSPSSAPSSSSSNETIFVGDDRLPLEGVIQFDKPSFSVQLNKWGRVALLSGGDVLALLLFSAIGRFSHGFPVFDIETLHTADPFIAGWFLSAYFLGGYASDGRGMEGTSKAITAAAKSWGVGIPLGIIIRAVTSGHVPAIPFIAVTMGSTAVLLIGWRTLLFNILPSDKKNDVYKRGSPFELFELLTSLIRRW